MPNQFEMEEQDRTDAEAKREAEHRAADTKKQDEAAATATSKAAEKRNYPPLDRVGALEARIAALEARFSAPGIPLGQDAQGRLLNPGHDAFGKRLKPGDSGYVTP